MPLSGVQTIILPRAVQAVMAELPLTKIGKLGGKVRAASSNDDKCDQMGLRVTASAAYNICMAT
eukprot:scaffold370251_cov27-Prasinocladus_malaysianus.AAC.1